MSRQAPSDIRARAAQLRERAEALEQVANLQALIEQLASQVPPRSAQRAALQPYTSVVDMLLLDEMPTLAISRVALACQEVLQTVVAGRIEEGGEIKQWGWPCET